MQDFCFHTHTVRCPHVDQTITDESTIEGFLKAGFKSLAFTDHCPWQIFDYNGDTNHAMPFSLKDDYLNSIHRLAEKYKNDMEILCGWEMEYMVNYKSEMDRMYNEASLIVLGQHFCPLPNGSYIKLHTPSFVPDEKAQSLYVKAIESACKEGYPTILAHPDLYMIHIDKFTDTEAKTARALCEIAEKYKIPMEINLCQTSRKTLGDFKVSYPRREFWEIARNYDIRVLYGFDYHGVLDPKVYPQAIDIADEIIGADTLSKLTFCSRSDIQTR